MITNLTKTAVLLAALGGLFIALGSVIGGSTGATIGLVIGIVVVGWSYWGSDKLAIRAAQARPLEEGELPELRRMVEELSQEAGIPMPRLYVSPSMQPNAFATGRNPKHAAVAVTQGILQVLDWEELRGVLAHELGHVKNRDILITSVAAALGMAISWVANIGLFFGGGNDEDSPNPVVALLLALVAPLMAMVLQMALSRSREFQADTTGAHLIHDGEPLARALVKIENYAQQIPMNVNPAQAQAYIINPLGGFNLQRMLSTHPSTSERASASPWNQPRSGLIDVAGASSVRSHWRRIWRITVGSLLVLIGLALCVLPGPGLLTIIAGLAVMADEVPFAHRIMVRLKARARQAEQRIRRAVDQDDDDDGIPDRKERRQP